MMEISRNVPLEYRNQLIHCGVDVLQRTLNQ
jgi:hypothetical protein